MQQVTDTFCSEWTIKRIWHIELIGCHFTMSSASWIPMGAAFPIWKKGSCQELSQIQLKPVSWHHSFFRSLFLHNGPACTPGAWTGNHIFHAFILELLATIRFHGINHLMNQGNGTGLLHIRPLVSISDRKKFVQSSGRFFFWLKQKKAIELLKHPNSKLTPQDTSVLGSTAF